MTLSTLQIRLFAISPFLHLLFIFSLFSLLPFALLVTLLYLAGIAYLLCVTVLMMLTA